MVSNQISRSRRQHSLKRSVRQALELMLLAVATASLYAAPLSLRTGAQGLPVVTAASPSVTEQFAASELAHYLHTMTGAHFEIQTAAHLPQRALVVGRAAVQALDPQFALQNLGSDGFIIQRARDRVLIAGSSDRGTLYGVYAFLEKLGCRWFAPQFDFYGAAGGELVPHVKAPQVGNWQIVERPAFRWRKLYIEEGHSHTTQNLRQMIDWMAKVRMNVLDCPIDYQHLHHTEWDKWRTVLIPELRKRGILIEVGGHGYPNFLPQDKYFAQHPDWFGMHNGKRTRDPRVVFATSNPEAMRTFVGNVKLYLKSHPEIDILDVWPPDGVEWSDAPADVALGTPSQRQMQLLNHLASELKPEFPHLRVQFIAYEDYTAPPAQDKPGPGIVMEFCPIDRSFESPLYASSYQQNLQYFQDLEQWVHGPIDPANITIYSYITKYAWRSLPIVIPHLILADARRFQSMGIGGMATYSEPGNWATFELDHYITARALWNPQLDVKQEMADYTSKRYGAAGAAVLQYLNLVEAVVPHAVGIPGTVLTLDKQRMLLHEFAPAAALLQQAHAAAAGDPALQLLLAKLDRSYAYAQNEMQLRLLLLQTVQGAGGHQLAALDQLLNARARIINASSDDGVILHDGRIP